MLEMSFLQERPKHTWLAFAAILLGAIGLPASSILLAEDSASEIRTKTTIAGKCGADFQAGGANCGEEYCRALIVSHGLVTNCEEAGDAGLTNCCKYGHCMKTTYRLVCQAGVCVLGEASQTAVLENYGACGDPCAATPQP